jgi:hypothetical protein
MGHQADFGSPATPGMHGMLPRVPDGVSLQSFVVLCNPVSKLLLCMQKPVMLCKILVMHG